MVTFQEIQELVFAIRVLFLMQNFIHNENPGRSKNMRFWGSETTPGQEISPGMTRRAPPRRVIFLAGDIFAEYCQESVNTNM